MGNTKSGTEIVVNSGKIVGTYSCPYCRKAKTILEQKTNNLEWIDSD